MSEKIEPALSAAEWQDFGAGDGVPVADDVWMRPTGFLSESQCVGHDGMRASALIALANAALPDDDPRKITRDTVSMLRASAEDDQAAYDNYAKLAALADALESYLPPSGT